MTWGRVLHFGKIQIQKTLLSVVTENQKHAYDAKILREIADNKRDPTYYPTGYYPSLIGGEIRPHRVNPLRAVLKAVALFDGEAKCVTANKEVHRVVERPDWKS